MEELSRKYRLNHHIFDEGLNVNDIAHYDLFFLIEKKNLRVCIIDARNHQCIFLEDYKFSNVLGVEDLINNLNELHESHKLLPAGYWKRVRLGVRDEAFTFIPSLLFDEAHLPDYIKLVKGKKEPEDDLFFYKQLSTSATNVFTASKRIIDWFRSNYPTRQIEIVHQASAFLEGVMQENSSQEPSIHICTESRYLDILVIQGNQLLHANTFSYHSPQDYVYFLMFVMDELKLNPITCPVTLYGEISPDSSIYTLVLKYVKQVSLGNKPSSVTFGYQFDEILDHRYFDLYSMYFCSQ
ncbi:MAG: DUF3822 family protein [Bacteroidota bacterium]